MDREIICLKSKGLWCINENIKLGTNRDFPIFREGLTKLMEFSFMEKSKKVLEPKILGTSYCF